MSIVDAHHHLWDPSRRDYPWMTGPLEPLRRPPAIAAGGWEPWSRDLERLAGVERVHCKLSGLVTEARWDRWRADGIERYVDRLLELFGPGRLMFGSDWPVCTLAASYREVLDLAVAGLSAAERERILHTTATRFHGLD